MQRERAALLEAPIRLRAHAVRCGVIDTVPPAVVHDRQCEWSQQRGMHREWGHQLGVEQALLPVGADDRAGRGVLILQLCTLHAVAAEVPLRNRLHRGCDQLHDAIGGGRARPGARHAAFREELYRAVGRYPRACRHAVARVSKVVSCGWLRRVRCISGRQRRPRRILTPKQRPRRRAESECMPQLMHCCA